MEALLAVNSRYRRTVDGRVWTEGATWHYESFRPYLDTFDRLRVAARVRQGGEPSPGATRADGERVVFEDLPWFVGPRQYLLRLPQLRRACRRLEIRGRALILRLPAWHVTYSLYEVSRGPGYPYGVEVHGQAAQQILGRGGGLLSNSMARRVDARSRLLSGGAAAASYVTREALQALYPAADGAPSFGFSSGVSLPPEAYVDRPRTRESDGTPLRLVFVGSLQSRVKGVDVLIEALARCHSAGTPVELSVVGTGERLPALQKLARERGVADRVRFAGRLEPGDAVREELDRADLFVLPSRSEGLPRALVEAMARGLPCLATRVGGVPEVLSADDLVEPGSPVDLAAAISDVLGDEARLAAMSTRNQEAARAFEDQRVRSQSSSFHRSLERLTRDWLRGDGS